LDKENVEAAGIRNMRWSRDKICSWSQYCCSSCGVLRFTGVLSRLRIQEVRCNKGYTPFATVTLSSWKLSNCWWQRLIIL
jgi:hypothetical protein